MKSTSSGSGQLSPAGFARAVAGLGSTTDTAVASVRDRFAADRPWGASARGYLTYSTDCTCFRYDATVKDIA